MNMGQGLLGLFLLLWMVLRVDGEDNMSNFIRDVISTFQLTLPTIVYDADEEAPDICYTDQWVLCLPSRQPDCDKEESHPSGMQKIIFSRLVQALVPSTTAPSPDTEI